MIGSWDGNRERAILGNCPAVCTLSKYCDNGATVLKLAIEAVATDYLTEEAVAEGPTTANAGRSLVHGSGVTGWLG